MITLLLNNNIVRCRACMLKSLVELQLIKHNNWSTCHPACSSNNHSRSLQDGHMDFYHHLIFCNWRSPDWIHCVPEVHLAARQTAKSTWKWPASSIATLASFSNIYIYYHSRTFSLANTSFARDSAFLLLSNKSNPMNNSIQRNVLEFFPLPSLEKFLSLPSRKLEIVALTFWNEPFRWYKERRNLTCLHFKNRWGAQPSSCPRLKSIRDQHRCLPLQTFIRVGKLSCASGSPNKMPQIMFF